MKICYDAPMNRRVIYTILLSILPLWWAFAVLWLPGSMHALANLSYRFTPLQIPEGTATLARERALTYVTRGGEVSEDIYFTRDEVSHLLDVHRIYTFAFFGMNSLATVCWIVLIVALIQKQELHRSCRYSARVLAVFITVSLLSLLFFSSFFILFHQVLFPNGNWAFPADSLLISLFPEIFWKFELAAFVAMVALSAGLYALLGRKRLLD